MRRGCRARCRRCRWATGHRLPGALSQTPCDGTWPQKPIRPPKRAAHALSRSAPPPAPAQGGAACVENARVGCCCCWWCVCACGVWCGVCWHVWQGLASVRRAPGLAHLGQPLAVLPKQRLPLLSCPGAPVGGACGCLCRRLSRLKPRAGLGVAAPLVGELAVQQGHSFLALPEDAA